MHRFRRPRSCADHKQFIYGALFTITLRVHITTHGGQRSIRRKPADGVYGRRPCPDGNCSYPRPVAEFASPNVAETARPSSTRHPWWQLGAGVVLLGATAAACVTVAGHRQPYAIDLRILSSLPRAYHNRWLGAVADLGATPTFLTGIIIAAAVAFRYDRVVALSCIVGPATTLLVVQLSLKPDVARYLGGGLSFPSGHVAAATAMVAAFVIATRGKWRLVAIVLGGVVVVSVSIAVIALGWHYPTDTVGGILTALAGVTFIDAVVGLVAESVAPKATHPVPRRVGIEHARGRVTTRAHR
jgi:membrane-associated phospholipid phosphatase